MRKFSIEVNLHKILDKLYKKDKKTYNILLKKFEEILNRETLDHYKNLRKPLQHFKRVHVNGPFVLVFKHIESEDKVVFYDFAHHDTVYEF